MSFVLSDAYNYFFVGVTTSLLYLCSQNPECQFTIVCRNQIPSILIKEYPHVTFLSYNSDSENDVLPSKENNGDFASANLKQVVLEYYKAQNSSVFMVYCLKYVDIGLLNTVLSLKKTQVVRKNDVAMSFSSFLVHDVDERNLLLDTYEYYMNKKRADGVAGLSVLKLAHFISDLKVDTKGLHVETWQKGVFPTEWKDCTKHGKHMSLTPVSYIAGAIAQCANMDGKDVPLSMNLVSHDGYSVEERRMMSGRGVPSEVLAKVTERKYQGIYRDVSLRTTKKLCLYPLDRATIQYAISRATSLHDKYEKVSALDYITK